MCTVHFEERLRSKRYVIKSKKILVIIMQSDPLRSVNSNNLVVIAETQRAVVRDSPRSSVVSNTSRSQVSPVGDPTPFVAPTVVTSATNTQLHSLYRKQAIFSCLLLVYKLCNLCALYTLKKP